MRNDAVIIGNGTSRLNFDLHKIKDKFVTYGCNALYRDFIPDYLISMDIHMVNEIINAKAHNLCKFYTQHVNDIDELQSKGERINFVQTYVATPDSGTAAVELASKNEHNKIYIIGFDYHNCQNNNVYAGTINYQHKNYSTPIVQDEKWRSRLYNIVKKYPNMYYIHVTDDDHIWSLNNLDYYTTQQFKEILC